jgi:hypothetical protein
MYHTLLFKHVYTHSRTQLEVYFAFHKQKQSSPPPKKKNTHTHTHTPRQPTQVQVNGLPNWVTSILRQWKINSPFFFLFIFFPPNSHPLHPLQFLEGVCEKEKKQGGREIGKGMRELVFSRTRFPSDPPRLFLFFFFCSFFLGGKKEILNGETGLHWTDISFSFCCFLFTCLGLRDLDLRYVCMYLCTA